MSIPRQTLGQRRECCADLIGFFVVYSASSHFCLAYALDELGQRLGLVKRQFKGDGLYLRHINPQVSSSLRVDRDVCRSAS